MVCEPFKAKNLWIRELKSNRSMGSILKISIFSWLYLLSHFSYIYPLNSCLSHWMSLAEAFIKTPVATTDKLFVVNDTIKINLVLESLKFYFSSDNRSKKLLFIGINRLNNKFDGCGTESRRDRFHSKSMESKIASCQSSVWILASDNSKCLSWKRYFQYHKIFFLT